MEALRGYAERDRRPFGVCLIGATDKVQSRALVIWRLCSMPVAQLRRGDRLLTRVARDQSRAVGVSHTVPCPLN